MTGREARDRLGEMSRSDAAETAEAASQAARPGSPRTVHVAIGNSDDRLTQHRWYEFVGAVDALVRRFGDPIYGFWVSPSASPHQNAAWAFQIHADDDRDALRALLAAAAGDFEQESVAWNESETEFLRPDGGTDPLFPLDR